MIGRSEHRLYAADLKQRNETLEENPPPGKHGLKKLRVGSLVSYELSKPLIMSFMVASLKSK